MSVIEPRLSEQVAADGRAFNLAEGGAVLRLVRVNYDEQGVLVDGDIEHWLPDAIRICLDTRVLQPIIAKAQPVLLAESLRLTSRRGSRRTRWD